MSKAILVIDNPNRCADCPLRCSVGGVQPFCSKTFQTLSDDEYYNKKPIGVLCVKYRRKRISEKQKQKQLGIGLKDTTLA